MDPHRKILISNLDNRHWNDTVFKPLEIDKIGLYSVTKERKYVNNANNLKYFYVPDKLSFDLNIGYGTALKKDWNENMGLNHILIFIKDNQNNLIERSESPDEPNRLKADIVCYRGTMRIIMSTPYEISQEWRVLVSKFNGTIYMIREDTPEKKMELLNRSDWLKRLSSWGFKFQQYCTTNTFNKPPNIEEPVDECSELGCLFKTNINGRTYMYSAEMHCIDSAKPVGKITKEKLGSLRFVELKTRNNRFNPRQRDTYYRHRTRNWWLQSYLAGIDDIFVGLRDERGFVKAIEQISTEDLLNEAARRGDWYGSACLKFLDTFNNQVAKVMDDITDPNTVVQFDYNSDTNTVTYKVLHGKTSKSFLPNWYQDLVNKKRSASSIMWFIFMILKFFKSAFSMLSIKKTHLQPNHQHHH